MKRFIFFCLLITSNCFADNGHTIATYKTDSYNIAIFAEPWPLRVGELQFRAIVTDHTGNLLLDPAIVPFEGEIHAITIEEPSTYYLAFNLAGETQESIELTILPKASLLSLHWEVWTCLIFGLVFIILREILAKNQDRRYPNR